MEVIATAHSSQAYASTPSELNLLLTGLKIAESQEVEKSCRRLIPDCVKRENQKLLVLAQNGEGQSLLHRGSQDNGYMSQDYSGLHC